MSAMLFGGRSYALCIMHLIFNTYCNSTTFSITNFHTVDKSAQENELTNHKVLTPGQRALFMLHVADVINCDAFRKSTLNGSDI